MSDPKKPLDDLHYVVSGDMGNEWVYEKPKVAATSKQAKAPHTYTLKIPNTLRHDRAWWYCPRCASVWSQPGRCSLSTLPSPITGMQRPNFNHSVMEPRPRLCKLPAAASEAAYAVGGREAVQAIADHIVFGPRVHDPKEDPNNGNP